MVKPERINPFFAMFRGFGPATAFLIVLLLVAVVLLAVDVVRLHTRLADLGTTQQEHEAKRRILEGQLEEERKRNEVLSKQLGQQPNVNGSQKTPVTNEPGAEPVILAMTLLPATSRGLSNVPVLNITPKVGSVRTTIVIDREESFERFRVFLRGPGGGPSWSQMNLTARTGKGGRLIEINLPADVLTEGVRELVLQGMGPGGGDIGFYYFEVKR